MEIPKFFFSVAPDFSAFLSDAYLVSLIRKFKCKITVNENNSASRKKSVKSQQRKSNNMPFVNYLVWDIELLFFARNDLTKRNQSIYMLHFVLLSLIWSSFFHLITWIDWLQNFITGRLCVLWCDNI